nr:MAG TPA: hypothetical protein [Caudoviricetes sp.]
MFLFKLGFACNILEQGFRSGGVVSAIGEQSELFAKVCILIGVAKSLVRIPSYIVNFDIFKGVERLKPIGIERKHTLIKIAVAGVTVLHFVGFKFLRHQGDDVKPLALYNMLAFHAADVDFLFVGIVGGIEQHLVVPRFTNDKIMAYKGIAVLIAYNIPDVINKRLGGGDGFRVERNNIHFFVLWVVWYFWCSRYTLPEP